MKKSFISLLRKALLLPPIIVILSMVSVWIMHEYMSWKKEVDEETINLLEERKSFLRERALLASYFIEYQRDATGRIVKSGLASRVDEAERLIESVYELSPEIKGDKLESVILKALDDHAFSGAGGFVMSDSGVILEHSGDLKPFVDCNLKKIPAKYLMDNYESGIDKIRRVSFVTEKSEARRIFCLKKISGLGWIIGVSSSYENIENEAKETVKGWFSIFDSTGSKGFMFITDSEGTIVSSSGFFSQNGLIPGGGSPGSIDAGTMKTLSEKKGDFTEIFWPDKKAGQTKKSLVTGFSIPGWEWTMGVGFFTDDLDDAFKLKKNYARQEMIIGARYLVVILFVFMTCGFFIYKNISSKLVKNLLGFHDFFTNAWDKGQILSAEAMDFREFEAMAEAANSMLNEKKDSQDKLRQSEANFSSFFNSIDDSIFVLDENIMITAMNPSASKLTGIPQKALPERSIADLLDSVAVSGIRDFIKADDERSKALGQGYLSAFGGFAKNVETFVFRGIWDGNKAFFILCRDMSEIVASEAKFSTVFTASPVMMSISTVSDGKFMDVNRAATEMLGYPRDHFIGKTSVETRIFADPSWREKMRPLLENEGFVRNEEVDLVTKSGEILHCLFSIDFITLSGTRYILTVGNNITERKRAEQALLAAKEEALGSKAMLEETLRELEMFNNFMMDREERIISLKEEVNMLMLEAGRVQKYGLDQYDS